MNSSTNRGSQQTQVSTHNTNSHRHGSYIQFLSTYKENSLTMTTNQLKDGQTGPLDRPRRTSMPWCISGTRTVSDSRGSTISQKGQTN